jgi:transposase
MLRINADFTLFRLCGAPHNRKAWLFAGSELAGQRAAIVMSLVQSAKLNGLDPHAYLRDVLQRLPMHPASRLGELLPHRWQPSN